MLYLPFLSGKCTIESINFHFVILEKTNLIEVLKSFSKEELASFGDFIASPYHNKNSITARLYKTLKKYAPHYPAEKIKKEKIWAQLFPAKPYNYGTMKNLIFSLSNLAMKFLELENRVDAVEENNISLLEQLKKRGLTPLYFKKLREANADAGKAVFENLAPFYSYLREHSELNYLDYDYHYKEKKLDYSGLNRSLLLFCFCSYFLDNTNNLQNSLSMNVQIDSALDTAMVQVYEKLGIRDNFSDTFYYAYLTARSPENEESYYRFKELYFENFHLLSNNIQYNLAC